MDETTSNFESLKEEKYSNTSDNINEQIFDLENEINVRISLIESLPIDILVEVIKKLTGMYEFSGTNSLQSFLISIIIDSNLSSNIKAECARSLFTFEEFLEDTSNEEDSFLEIKRISNEQIILRNKKRKDKAYDTLLYLCDNFDNSISTTYKISLIFLLLEHTFNLQFYQQSLNVFQRIFNDSTIDCSFRYKTILSIDNHTLHFKQKYKFDSLHLFSINIDNLIPFRILSIQNILQNFKPDNYILYESILQGIAMDDTVEYNLRADSADTLLNQGRDEKNKENARKILLELGSAFGKIRTIYDNAQNVHTQKIEKSCEPIINFLLTVKTITINGKEIDGVFVSEQIFEFINQGCGDGKVQKKKDIVCDNCNPVSSSITNERIFCSVTCKQIFKRKDKITLSLSRISLDRGLYINLSLESILLKLWSYIVSPSHNLREELTKRLIEELEEMTGTCSSGFVTRLLNTISGYVEDVNLVISYEDQIISNFVGRLNSYTKQITLITSPFYSSKKYDVLKLYLKKQQSNNVEDLEERIQTFIDKGDDEKFKSIIFEFYDDVIDEMMEERSNYDKRQSFILFFRTYLSIIREQLYVEFKDFVNNYEFDIYFRKALATYEGLGSDFV
jgi:hypothetical protein